ncbi:crustacyanin-A2 subunit-like [Macrobrachium rosenbergii]|uniref:crustacyanin-A2 subunit-like n=1 Tax=Macrobrachium rosenbergii TaxID=79674 RepID=UPI0034D6FE38
MFKRGGILVAFLVASVAADGLPEFLVPGKCANVKVQSGFDLRKYHGRWYQTEILENPYQPYTKCINSFYDYYDAFDGFKVTTAGFSPKGEHLKLEGKIYPTKEFPTAHMLIDFPTVFAAPYQVIETDYYTYSCVYSCLEWGGYKTEFAFVFSRNPQNGGSATAKCAEVFKRSGIDFSKFVKVPHSAECVYRA